MPDEAAAMPGSPHDLLDRHALLQQRGDGGMRLLAPQIAFTLQPFRRGEQLRIDRDRAEGAADRPHGFADCVEEGAAGVLHQMPAVGDLLGIGQRLRRRLAVAPATIARQNADAGMFREPSLDGRGLPVWQQRHDAPTLQAAHQRPIPVIAPERPVIDADHLERLAWHLRPPAHQPQ
jgi:hypothetical protein